MDKTQILLLALVIRTRDFSIVSIVLNTTNGMVRHMR